MKDLRSKETPSILPLTVSIRTNKDVLLLLLQLRLIFLSRSVRFSNPTTSLCFSVASLIAVISYQAQEKLTTPFGPFRLQPLGCFNPT